MRNISKLLKAISSSAMVLLFVTALIFQGCGTKSGGDAESAEEATEQPSEHPSGGGDEHPTGGTTPADTTATESGGEHPSSDSDADDEHPSN